MAVTIRRVAGGLRQDGKLVPLEDGQPVPPPPEPSGGGNED